jgi:hypothetical protein
MSMKVLAFVFMASMVAFVWGDNEKYAIAAKDSVPVFKNDIHVPGETPLFIIGKQDRPLVISTGGKTYEIQKNDLIGWVDKEAVSVSSAKTMVFDTANVLGYLDNPTTLYILDANNPTGQSIKLERSFAVEILENVDRETVERQVAR